MTTPNYLKEEIFMTQFPETKAADVEFHFGENSAYENNTATLCDDDGKAGFRFDENENKWNFEWHKEW